MWSTLHIGLLLSVFFTVLLPCSGGGLFRKVKYKDKVKGENDIQLSSERRTSERTQVSRERTHCPLECVCQNSKVGRNIKIKL